MVKYFGHAQLIIKGLLEYFDIKKFNNLDYKGYVGNSLPWDNKFDQLKKHLKIK